MWKGRKNSISPLLTLAKIRWFYPCLIAFLIQILLSKNGAFNERSWIDFDRWRLRVIYEISLPIRIRHATDKNPIMEKVILVNGESIIRSRNAHVKMASAFFLCEGKYWKFPLD